MKRKIHNGAKTVACTLCALCTLLTLTACSAPAMLAKAGKANTDITRTVAEIGERGQQSARQKALLALSNDAELAPPANALVGAEREQLKEILCGAIERKDNPAAVDAEAAVLEDYAKRVTDLTPEPDAFPPGFAGWVSNGLSARTLGNSASDRKRRVERAATVAARCAKEFESQTSTKIDNKLMSVWASSQRSLFAVPRSIPDDAVRLGAAAVGTGAATATPEVGTEPTTTRSGFTAAPDTFRNRETTILLQKLADDQVAPVAPDRPRLSVPARLSVISGALSALDLLAENWAGLARLGALRDHVNDPRKIMEFENAADAFTAADSPIGKVIQTQRALTFRWLATAYLATLDKAASPLGDALKRLERQRAFNEFQVAITAWDDALRLDGGDIRKALIAAREAAAAATVFDASLPNVLDELQRMFRQAHALEQIITGGLTTLGKSSLD